MSMIAMKMALEKLANLLAEEVQLLGGVRQGVDELRDDLEGMRSFLQDAEARSEGDEGVKTWVKQVRDMAYDTEDVLAEFLLRLSPPQGHGFVHSLRKGFRYIHQLRTRHRLAVQIKNIKEKVKAISDRKNAFSFQRINEANAIQTWHDPRMASLFIDDADVVGIENPKNLLISWLVKGQQNLTAVSVEGMGGIGKTTLVKKTYDSPQIKECFDCHAWINVSKSLTAADLLQAALKSFLESAKEPIPEEIGMMCDLQLTNKLKNYLQHKRYVVVFDDVWSVNAWEGVRFAFPDCECMSRIIFTTRTSDIARHVETTGHVYQLQPLPKKEAWTLFCMKAFKGEQNGDCPEELKEMSKSILNKCGGLPLAIVTLGALLSRKNNQVLEWKKVHDSLGAEMKSNSNLESIERILVLSYKDLPYHLKCCYLYLSVFAEDYLIKRMKVIRLWVVERFAEEKPGFTAEEVAEDYLNELVSRSMIQVVHMDFFNRVLTCRVHDLMLKIIQSKSIDESLVMILNGRSQTLNEKVRRIALHDKFGDFPSAKKFPSPRSLLLFGSMGSSSISLGRPTFYGFRLMRVLELEGAPISQFPEELAGMIHLRYLSLRRTKIEKLPQSIRKLESLEILDLKHSLVSSIPDGILHLEHLSQLRNYRYHFDSSTIFPNSTGMQVPARIGRLTNLQKLGSIEVRGNGDLVREVGNLTQLRRLGILQLTQDDGIGLCSSLEKMEQLTALYMVSIVPSEFLPLDSLSSPPKFLQRLYIKCSLLTLPTWIGSLQHLGKLVLQYCNLNNDPLRLLQGLTNLVVFELREAYVGEDLCCDAGGYPRLKNLSLYYLKQLKCIRVEEGAMPGLRELNIVSCDKLDMVPVGIEHLRYLQDLVLWRMPKAFIEKIEHHKARIAGRFSIYQQSRISINMSSNTLLRYTRT